VLGSKLIRSGALTIVRRMEGRRRHLAAAARPNADSAGSLRLGTSTEKLATALVTAAALMALSQASAIARPSSESVAAHNRDVAAAVIHTGLGIGPIRLGQTRRQVARRVGTRGQRVVIGQRRYRVGSVVLDAAFNHQGQVEQVVSTSGSLKLQGARVSMGYGAMRRVLPAWKHHGCRHQKALVHATNAGSTSLLWRRNRGRLVEALVETGGGIGDCGAPSGSLGSAHG
jgi:hypothetical protein